MNDIAQMTDEEFQKMMKSELGHIGQENVNMVSFDNVLFDDCEPAEIHDNEYITKVFKILQQKMENFEEYTFVINSNIHSNIPNTANLSWIGDKRVLIWLSGEHKYAPMPVIKDNYHHIFSNYYWDTNNVTSIPLGYYANSKDVVNDELYDHIIPMEERLNNMNFIGCLNRNRMKFASLVSGVPLTALIFMFGYKLKLTTDFANHMSNFRNPRDYFKFTTDFAKGLDRTTYLNLLYSSKISLCPRGWRNTETFRLYESMRAGCVVITEKLPDRSYYKDIPAIQVDNWHDGLNIARDLLKDNSGLLTRLGEASRLFYETKLSPEATAKIIMDKLAEKAI